MTSVFAKANRYPIKALRGHQGDRVMYLALPNQRELDGFFHRETESPSGDEDRVQRPFEPKRAEEIGRYIEANPKSYVLGALTFAVDADGEFDETEADSGVGVLWLPLSAVVRSIDGQHRGGGVRQLLRTVRDLADQHVAILIYVESDTARRKQMFSDMNSHQKRVSGSINIAFDTRDPFANAARRIANEHPLLKGRIEELKPSVSAQSSKLYTLKAVYDTLKTCKVGVGGRVRTVPGEKELLTSAKDFFTLLTDARPELAEVAAGKLHPSDLRSTSLLANGPTLRAIAGGCRIARDRGRDAAAVRRGLKAIDFTPTNEKWAAIGFTAPGKLTASSRMQELKAAEAYIGQALDTFGDPRRAVESND